MILTYFGTLFWFFGVVLSESTSIKDGSVGILSSDETKQLNEDAKSILDQHETNIKQEIEPQHSDENNGISEKIDESFQVQDGSSIQTKNITALNVTKDVNSTLPYIVCNLDKDAGGAVELVNAVRLVQLLRGEASITHRKTKAECAVLLFYARYCPFSSMAAPHFNALPRAFPNIKIAAVDAIKYPSFNTQFGIVGVPTVMIFHNGRPAAKFNDSEYTLETFAKFITKHTGLEPSGKLFVMSADFGGPVSSVLVEETDYYLGLSVILIIAYSLYDFSKSTWWRRIVETVYNTWREAEAQHEHAE